MFDEDSRTPRVEDDVLPTKSGEFSVAAKLNAMELTCWRRGKVSLNFKATASNSAMVGGARNSVLKSITASEIGARE